MRIVLASVGLAAAVMAGPAFAHHSFAMFDNSKTVTWVGTVLSYDWTNPHSHIALMVPPTDSDPSLVGKWDIEAGSPNIMSRQGWTRNSFKPGDKITIVGHPTRDGSKAGSLYYAIDKNGKHLYADVNRNGAAGSAPASVPGS